MFSVGRRVRPRLGRDGEHLFLDETGQRAEGDQGGRDGFEGREGRQGGGEEEEGLRARMRHGVRADLRPRSERRHVQTENVRNRVRPQRSQLRDGDE